jgi:uncharacterized repeat protein (TIGR03803 family)
MDVDGNLYGTTNSGGKFGEGAIYELMHKVNGWSLTVIHSFCAEGGSCGNGSYPITTLAYAGQASGASWDEFSPLFGTADGGGASGQGVAYKLISDGSFWSYELLYGFDGTSEPSTYPSQLFVDSSGNLIGVTDYGAKHGDGALYKLAANTWKETTLHDFCAQPNCTDGAYGFGRLVRDAALNLYGTAQGGRNSGQGVVFKRTAGGSYSVVHSFGGAEGDLPMGGLTMDSAGNLFGMTGEGGANSQGVVFELAPGGAETVLYNFCITNGCPDGAWPETPLLMDSQGDLFGTTIYYGAHGNGGTVFELTP